MLTTILRTEFNCLAGDFFDQVAMFIRFQFYAIDYATFYYTRSKTFCPFPCNYIGLRVRRIVLNLFRVKLCPQRVVDTCISLQRHRTLAKMHSCSLYIFAMILPKS